MSSVSLVYALVRRRVRRSGEGGSFSEGGFSLARFPLFSSYVKDPSDGLNRPPARRRKKRRNARRRHRRIEI